MVNWLFEKSEDLSIDRTDIQLFGDSAGGNLVTNVALEILQWVTFTASCILKWEINAPLAGKLKSLEWEIKIAYNA